MNSSRALDTEAIARLETGHILVYSIFLEVMLADDCKVHGGKSTCAV